MPSSAASFLTRSPWRLRARKRVQQALAQAYEGAGRLMINCLRLGHVAARTEASRAANLVQTSSLPGGGDPPCGVAVFPG